MYFEDAARTCTSVCVHVCVRVVRTRVLRARIESVLVICPEFLIFNRVQTMEIIGSKTIIAVRCNDRKRKKNIALYIRVTEFGMRVDLNIDRLTDYGTKEKVEQITLI